jgi:hypothetical protein
MSQPRRRRRRRRRGGEPRTDQTASGREQNQKHENGSQPQAQAGKRSRGRRRGRGPRSLERIGSPKSSEDLVRAEPRNRPVTLTAQSDGTTLEQVIGELQSTWGVPQYPQEYRITIKIAEEKDARAERVTPMDEVVKDRAEQSQAPAPAIEGPRREKAPAAPRVRAGGEGPVRERAPRRRRRGRGRRRKGDGSGGDAPPSSPT